jgi:hypothetical protein
MEGARMTLKLNLITQRAKISSQVFKEEDLLSRNLIVLIKSFIKVNNPNKMLT